MTTPQPTHAHTSKGYNPSLHYVIVSPGSTPAPSRSIFVRPSSISHSSRKSSNASPLPVGGPSTPSTPSQLAQPFVTRTSSGGDDQLDLPIVAAPKRLKSFHSSPGCEIPPPMTPTTLMPIPMLPPHSSGDESHRLNHTRHQLMNLSIDPTASPGTSYHLASPGLGPILPPPLLASSQTPDGRSSHPSFSHRSWGSVSTRSSTISTRSSTISTTSGGGSFTSRCRPASSISNSSEFEENSDDENDNEGGGGGGGGNGNPCSTIPYGQYKPLLPTLPQTGGQFITCETMMELLRGSPTVGNNSHAAYAHLYDRVLVVDARFPYEYEGGHIKSSINLYKEQQVYEHFLRTPPPSMEVGQRTCIIFHCEFSQERGPFLFKRLRGRDRDMHGLKAEWSQLYYPEMYVLSGGYKAFYQLYGPTANSIAGTPTPHTPLPATPLATHQTPASLAASDAPINRSFSIPTTTTATSHARFRSIAGTSSTLTSPNILPQGSSIGSNLWPSMPSPVLPTENVNGHHGSPSAQRESEAAGTTSTTTTTTTQNLTTTTDEYFEPFGGYIRMRDQRFRSECAALLRDHDIEKKMTRSQSTGALSQVLGLNMDGLTNGVGSNGHSSNGTNVNGIGGGGGGGSSSRGAPSAAPSPAPQVRSLLSPRLDASTSSNCPVDNHFADLRTIRRRSLSTFAKIPAHGGSIGSGLNGIAIVGGSNGEDGHGTGSASGSVNTSLFSPLFNGRSPLARPFSAMDSPFSPSSSNSVGSVGGSGGGGPMMTSFSNGSSSLSSSSSLSLLNRGTTPSPSPLLMNFSLGSPTSTNSRTSTTIMSTPHSGISSLNCSSASPIPPTAPGLTAALHAAACASALSNHGQSPLLPPSSVLPPSPPQLIHSRSDFTTTSTTTFKRQLSSSHSVRSNGSSWGVQLSFQSATTPSTTTMILPTSGVSGTSSSFYPSPLPPVPSPMQCESSDSSNTRRRSSSHNMLHDIDIDVDDDVDDAACGVRVGSPTMMPPLPPIHASPIKMSTLPTIENNNENIFQQHSNHQEEEETNDL